MVVSHSLHIQRAFSDALDDYGLSPIPAWTTGEAEEILKRLPISVVFCSDELQNGGVNQLLRRISEGSDKIPFIVVSRTNDWERCRDFLQRGALDYVLYPFGQFEIERVVQNALSLVELRGVQQQSTGFGRGPLIWAQ